MEVALEDLEAETPEVPTPIELYALILVAHDVPDVRRAFRLPARVPVARESYIDERKRA